jgi:transcriptional regulator with XRE-family HTH domain
MNDMSDRLKWARKETGYTQRELAKASGVGLATVRRIEQRQFTPRLETIRRLAETLRIREAWLAYGEEPVGPLGEMRSDQRQLRRGEQNNGPSGH